MFHHISFVVLAFVMFSATFVRAAFPSCATGEFLPDLSLTPALTVTSRAVQRALVRPTTVLAVLPITPACAGMLATAMLPTYASRTRAAQLTGNPPMTSPFRSATQL